MNESEPRLYWWVMCTSQWSPWKFIRAEGPCWKGEVRFGLLTFGWQARGKRGDQ
jgi:hypothetical protein